MGPSWSSVVERPRLRIYWVASVLLIGQYTLAFPSRWNPVGEWFGAVNCLTLLKEKFVLRWRTRVVEVLRVTFKKDGKVIPTNTMFLTFKKPEIRKVVRAGYLQVKVNLFVPNLLRCFGCNKFGHTSDRCKVIPKCVRYGQDKHEWQCDGPEVFSNCKGPHASSAETTHPLRPCLITHRCKPDRTWNRSKHTSVL